MGDKDCELCQSYGCKVFGAYVLLCVVAVLIYILAVLGFEINESGDKATLFVGLLAWTGAMIVPVAAFYAISDWREQQRAIQLAQHTENIYKSIKVFHQKTINICSSTTSFAEALNKSSNIDLIKVDDTFTEEITITKNSIDKLIEIHGEIIVDMQFLVELNEKTELHNALKDFQTFAGEFIRLNLNFTREYRDYSKLQCKEFMGNCFSSYDNSRKSTHGILKALASFYKFH